MRSKQRFIPTPTNFLLKIRQKEQYLGGEENILEERKIEAFEEELPYTRL